MAKIIALFNQAGGVGKTTLTMNLGYQLSQRQHQVLLIDLDPQASLTTFMGIDPNSLNSLFNKTAQKLKSSDSSDRRHFMAEVV